MKKTVLYLISLLVVAALNAAPVDPQRAMQAAQEFVPVSSSAQAPSRIQQPATVVYTHPMPKSGGPAFYVVNVDGAFVLVSADDIAHPILGYNFGSNWPTNITELPAHIKSFFDDLAAQMEAVKEAEPNRAPAAEWTHPQNAPQRRTMANIPDSVGPLLTTTWDQGQHYNALCPEDQNSPYAGRCLTGCVATAMAQIINYWGQQMPIKTRGIHSYESNYGTLTVNYDSAHYDFAHMPLALTNSSTQQEVQAIATLMRDCGVAANMGYGPMESGAYDIDARSAFINHFRFSPNTSEIVRSIFSDTEWQNILRENLAANRPILYSGQGSGGHTFVCDGYKLDNYYHFNFGWGGLADGWFLTTAITPGGQRDYSSDQTAVVSIVPDSTGNVILSQLTQGASTFFVTEPMELYHASGYNMYQIPSYNDPCNGTVYFISADTAKQLVADIISYEDQNVMIYDGVAGNQLAALCAGGDNSLSPAVSTSNSLRVYYQGNMYTSGYHLRISQNDGCRMVSNIVAAVDTTTVHLTWTENGIATQWEIEYGEKGFQLGDGTTIIANTNLIDIICPKKLTEYDIYIRPICGCGWNKITVFSEAPYWQDIVTEQPASYVIDEVNHCINISCAEDFVWFCSHPSIYDAIIVDDIDLGGYKWKPSDTWNQRNINGNGHIITNLYINEVSPRAALLSTFLGTIKDFGIENSYIKGTSGVASFCGELNGLGSIINCHVSNSIIIGTDIVGGLVAYHNGTIKNSYSNVQVNGNRWTGLLTGNSGGTITNCYAAGSIQLRSFCYYAGISAYAATGVIDKCYSIDLPMGVVGYEGMTEFSDTASFYRSSNQWTLRTPIIFDEGIATDLLDALNKGVNQMNDSSIRIWEADTNNQNNGLPKFGNHFTVQCPNVNNLTVKNIKNQNVTAVVVDWEEKGNAVNWEIRYQPLNTPVDSATTIVVNQKPYILYNVPLAKEYTFSVRSIYNDSTHSGWEKKREMVDLPFWTDIVTEKPEGYVEDSDGNVYISSAEGLAWLAAVVNGFHGNSGNSFEGKIVSIMEDIDLQGYRWYPIGRGWYANPNVWSSFQGTFEGNLHSISNMYVNCSYMYLGLFGFAYNGAELRNISIKQSSVNSYFCDVDDGGHGGLLGKGSEIKAIQNCSSDACVKGMMQVGSLCGYLFDQEGEEGIITNCYATGDVYGRESTAGLIGEARGVAIQNCYARGNVYLHDGGWNPWYRGGLIGNLMSNAMVTNCYSTGIVEIDDNSYRYGRVVGCPYMDSKTHYIYGLKGPLPLTGYSASDDEIADTASFVTSNNSQLLLTPISINNQTYDTLIEALNAWVSNMNNQSLKTWAVDTLGENDGYPIFGGYYVPTCYNPKVVIASNATIVGDDTIRTRIEWEQEGNPLSWEILYVNTQQSLDSGTIVPVNSNPCVLTNLPTGEWLDLYVRAICAEGDTSGWSKPVIYIPDKLYWTDVVTSQPEGYQDDGNGNVYINSAEGLAWLSAIENGLVDNNVNYNIKNIYLTSDIDLHNYRWKPIWNAQFNCISGIVFDGSGHVISGLYCNEYANMQGLFSRVNESFIKNLIIESSVVKGLLNNGTIAGVLDRTNVVNCIVSGEVYGVLYSGGIVGNGEQDVLIKNVAFTGIADTRRDITLPNCYNGYAGGISGTNYSIHVENIYVAAEIPFSPYSGIVSGSGFGLYSNVYAMSYPTTLSITYDNFDTNSSFFTGSGTSWTLNTPPYINGVFHSDLVSALNAWVDANNAGDQYRHWVADTAMVNGGFPIFAPMEEVGPTTDIFSVSIPASVGAQKIFINGHFYIRRDGVLYDATGKKVR